MFESLSDRLEGALKTLKGEHKLTELNIAESIKEIRRALVAADVNYKIAKDFTDAINPLSIVVLTGCRVEPGLAAAPPGSRYQFLRLGYFCADTKLTTPQKPVFNRTVTLKDTWAKIDKAQKQAQAANRRR